MKIYLAGPDVFRGDAAEHGARLVALCGRYGMAGLFPLDEAIGRELEGREAAQAICQANLDLLGNADLVMANLNPFRGHEPDSGTVFEIGYAHARGIPVWAYLDPAVPVARRVPGRRTAGGELVDAEGWRIEDFGLPLNLMLACSARIVAGGPEDCLRRIAAERGPSRPASAA